jgi:hypothetical protein
LPRHKAPATYRTRWQVLRSSDSASKVSVLTTVRSSLSHTCRGWQISRPAGGIGRRRRRSNASSVDPFRLSVRMQVMRIVLAIGVKALLDGKLDREAARERDRQRVLERLSPGLRARLRDGAEAE